MGVLQYFYFQEKYCIQFSAESPVSLERNIKGIPTFYWKTWRFCVIIN